MAKVERALERRGKRAAQRSKKQYPGEMLHFDTKRLPLLTGEKRIVPREYLFVAIDDCSRELDAAILPDTTQPSAATFLDQVLQECPYTIEWASSDSGTKYKGTVDQAFVARCHANGTGQKFTRVRRPQTKGKAERVIKTLLEMWQTITVVATRKDRQRGLARFINF